MKTNILAVMAALVVAGGAGFSMRGRAAGAGAAVAPIVVSPAGHLPTTRSVRSLLDNGTHFSEFVEVPAGRASISAYVSYPDRDGKAPAVLLSGDDGGYAMWQMPPRPAER